ncbi:hypothetical protein [Bradyrhizobium cenepequi]
MGAENAYGKSLLDLDAVGVLRGSIVEPGGGPVGLSGSRQTDVLLAVARSANRTSATASLIARRPEFQASR